MILMAKILLKYVKKKKKKKKKLSGGKFYSSVILLQLCKQILLAELDRMCLWGVVMLIESKMNPVEFREI